MNGYSVLVLVLAVGAVCAEPPRFRRVQRFRNGNVQFARQEVESTTSAEDATESSDAGGPYPPAAAPYQPSGWKPSGRLLTLPTERQQQPPATSYGTPDSSYGPPQEATTPAEEEDTPTPNPEAENLSEVEQVGARGQQPNNGYYFVQFAAPPQAVASANLRVQPVALTEQVYFTNPIVVPSRYVAYNSAFTQTW
ncbi:uncharacterized protein LOC129797745 [Lutzomyia longipalpis]|uniref:Putative conserved secreted protein n=1 Tax=Lutzomyia longipalpis TaxID=7200 RepID=A0A1B0CJC4_LUTLO|nr:uncharacterized protein LOC129797745 [Lutzomyia longipalpis]